MLEGDGHPAYCRHDLQSGGNTRKRVFFSKGV